MVRSKRPKADRVPDEPSEESLRRAALCEELDLTDEELNSFIGSKRQDKKERWLLRKQREEVEWWNQ